MNAFCTISLHAIARNICLNPSVDVIYVISETYSDEFVFISPEQACLVFALLSEVYPEQAAAVAKKWQSRFFRQGALVASLSRQLYPEFKYLSDAKAYFQIKRAERWLAAPDRQIALHLSRV